MKTPYSYPLLEEVSRHFDSKKGNFDDVYILACQHILEPQAKMFELLTDFGIPKTNIQIFGKIYSTSKEVLQELSNAEFNINQPIFDQSISFDVEHSDNCRKQLESFLPTINVPAKLVILDDGGELLRIVNEKFDSISKDISIVGIEQTSSGFRKLEKSQVHFPIFNVARSAVKLVKESPLIAELGCNRMVDAFSQYSISEPRILVVGLGPMGSNTLSIFKEKGYFALGYDSAQHDKSELVNLIRDNNIDVVIGVTGSNILNEEQLQEIKNLLDYKLYLTSMSSADREFPTIYIRKNGTRSSEIHGDVVWDNLVLMNNGFPITFKGNRYESTPEEIERTIGLLYGSTLEAITNNEISEMGFVDVPSGVTDILDKHE